MAPKRAAATKAAAATKDAMGSKNKANVGAKVTKPAPPKKATPAAKPVAKVATKAKAPAKAPAKSRAKAKKAETPVSESDDEDEDEPEAEEETKPVKAAKTKVNGPTTKKAAPKKSSSPAAEPAKKTTKRKAEEEAPAKPTKKPKIAKRGAVINEPPTDRLHVYVFGEGTAGELGLGTEKKAVDVKRPRLNPFLDAEKVGVVKLTSGGMHNVAITHDNKILTWGVNDQGALGRDTNWEGGLKDMDEAEGSEDESDDEDNGLNPKESLPGEVDFSEIDLPEGTRWVDVAAGDSSSFALTDDGHVYGWGTFRSNEGIFGFTIDTFIAKRPVLLDELNNIVSIKAGANHAMAMDTKGAVFAWGSGQQNQLGRRVIERTKDQGLRPREFGLPKGKKGITAIETGGYHSFAISKTGEVYSWGLNSFGETGHMHNAGQDNAVILHPEVITSLKGKDIVSIKGAGHHSLAATKEGDCLIWGRLDGAQCGLSKEQIDSLPADSVIRDEHNKPRILTVPTKPATIQGKVVHVTGNSDHSIVVTEEGKAWSWGFSANYQTGQGTIDDVDVATLIDNTAVRDKKLTGAETGGQFSILTAKA